MFDFEMAYPAYLRERARDLRVTKKLSLDEIAERLALPKTTVYHWIRDLPLGRARRENGWPDAARRKGNEAMKKKYRLLREKAYSRGLAEYDELVLLPTLAELQRFWGGKLQVPSEDVRLQPKSNSGQLRGRVWRCPYGVASVAIYDTYFRARIGAWMDRSRRAGGRLESAAGRGAIW